MAILHKPCKSNLLLLDGQRKSLKLMTSRPSGTSQETQTAVFWSKSRVWALDELQWKAHATHVHFNSYGRGWMSLSMGETPRVQFSHLNWQVFMGLTGNTVNPKESVYICWFTCVCVHMCTLEIRGQCAGIESTLLSCGFQGLNSGHRVWWPLPSESSHQPCEESFNRCSFQFISISSSS